ncbi:hypothetical protein [Legionella waltersii]|uniref:Substrate of the Dot/Icm secretion system n=1 Tax=Legionella waltersii TaxID=66969 RepID=A0A0W1A2S6_9GAMM|nr:hypothetical protein [Legionella waltersii]KTD75626.1 substrate of the Dot/Icm secretion system [Legionella waltersii]SNU98985.1 Dot/Icm secretion system substrate [Legionella waltersii]
MGVSKKEIDRLLELKKKQEQSELEILVKQELLRLQGRYWQFATMNAKQMEKELQEKGYPSEIQVKSKQIGSIVDDYKEKYSKESWYKEPQIEEGKTNLVFPSDEEVGNFFKDQAQNHKCFIIIDGATNKVLAYSNGDGVLYNGNKTVYNGGKFSPSEVDFSNFKVPKAEEQTSGMQLA